MEPAHQFYGDRIGGVRDREEITWWIVMHINWKSTLTLRALLDARG